MLYIWVRDRNHWLCLMSMAITTSRWEREGLEWTPLFQIHIDKLLLMIEWLLQKCSALEFISMMKIACYSTDNRAPTFHEQVVTKNVHKIISWNMNWIINRTKHNWFQASRSGAILHKNLPLYFLSSQLWACFAL